MGMPGEDKVDERAAAVVCDVDGVVGLVSHQDYRGVGLLGDGQRNVGLAACTIIKTAEEDVLALSVDADVFIDEQG